VTAPDRFGRYQVIEELGAGAMGRVYLAADPLIDRMVALKVITIGGTAAERAEFIERFRTEVRAAAQCAHPAIVAVHDFVDDPEAPFFVMEHVPGTTLAAELAKPDAERRAAVPRLVAAMLEVLAGLGAAHAVGVIHRDIKPGNIMITPRGAVKIADFGIARLGASAMTMVGDMIGTPSYMAPEQAMGQAVDHRADLFAVAAVLYEIVYGRPPFAGSNMTQTLMRLTGPEPADVSALAGTSMGEVLRRGLAKDPAQRFASAAAFAALLRQAIARRAAPPEEDATRVVTPPPPPPPVAHRRAALPDATIGKAADALAFFVGPIAGLLARRAADQASDPADFAELLCRHVAAEEAPALRARLRRLT
jgi:serine/threonine-protein kinase